jgi:hypothetical protein
MLAVLVPEGFKSLTALVAALRLDPRLWHAHEVRIPTDNRRALLGEFLEMNQLEAVIIGRYDMGNGEWVMRTGRRFIRITAHQQEKT